MRGHHSSPAAGAVRLAASVTVFVLLVAVGVGVGVAVGLSGQSHSTGRPVGIRWDAVRLPLGCASAGVDVLQRVVADVTGGSRVDAVEIARCASGAGSPPAGLFVLEAPARAAAVPTLLATLVPVSRGWLLSHLSLQGPRISAESFSYSSPTVPRCCPDRQRVLAWTWTGHAFAPAGA